MWGPWITHDGKGCPIRRGQIAEVQWADGTSVIACNEGQSAAAAGVISWQTYKGPTYASSWVWDEPGSKIPVARYRIRKPRGLQILEDNLAEIDTPIQEVV